ncbi:hypothetical protein GC174_04605 [bacterium]|nr:hypothetical protein [bacterium]
MPLVNLLKVGLVDEFEAEFKRAATASGVEDLVRSLNLELERVGLAMRVSQAFSRDGCYVTVIGQSRFFDEGYMMRRLKFPV